MGLDLYQVPITNFEPNYILDSVRELGELLHNYTSLYLILFKSEILASGNTLWVTRPFTLQFTFCWL